MTDRRTGEQMRFDSKVATVTGAAQIIDVDGGQVFRV